MRNFIRNSETKERVAEDIKKSVLANLQRTGLPLEKVERNIDKLHRVGRFDHETQTQPIIVKFRTSKKKSTTSGKNLQKELKFRYH